MERRQLVRCPGSSCVAMKVVSVWRLFVAIAAPYILVQRQTTDGPQWILVVRPGEGAIENVNRRILYFVRLHDLHAQKPCGKVALLDLVEEIFDMVIRL